MSTHSAPLRVLAVIAALVGWGTLVLQFYLLVFASGREVGVGIVNFFGFFTILTNILAALALTVSLLRPNSSLGRFFSRPGVVTAVAAAIAMVGVGYSLLLRHSWKPQGWQLVADEGLHDVVPVLFLIYWWFTVPKGAVRWTDIPRWCVYAVVYILYVLVLGERIGRYPYHFMDPGTIGYGRVLVNAVALVLAFAVIGVILVGASALKRDPVPSTARPS
jgi:hypothetical protein